MKHSNLKKAAALAACLLATSYAAFAQKDASTILSTTLSTLKTLATPILNIFSIILGLIAIVMLAPDMAKFMKGEGTSADSLLKHGGGLLIAVIFMQIIRVTLLS